MTDQPELERRLLATGYDRDNFPRMNSERWLPVGLAKEAAAEIARLRAERDQLIAALKPFAEYYDLLKRNDYLGTQLISRGRDGSIRGHASVQEPELEAAWTAIAAVEEKP